MSDQQALVDMFPKAPISRPALVEPTPPDPVQIALANAMRAMTNPSVAVPGPAAAPVPAPWTPDTVFGAPLQPQQQQQQQQQEGMLGAGEGISPSAADPPNVEAPGASPAGVFGAPPPVFGAQATYQPSASAPVLAPAPAVASSPPLVAAVPTAAQYLANLKRQQEAQYAQPAGALPAQTVSTPAHAPRTAATAVVAPRVAAPVQTELKLSDLVFPMDCVCLKKTVVREGFELSSKQVRRLLLPPAVFAPNLHHPTSCDILSCWFADGAARGR